MVFDRMKIFKTVRDLKNYLKEQRKNGKSIGFVPTMGALHAGHVSLMNQAKKKNEIVVCSIFVNPTQFNESSDLKKYPRPIKKDTALLKKNKVDILFLPSVKAVYPKGKKVKPNVDLKGLDQALEGKFRPGHFEGVVQVVHRLLEIVNPTHLYMGQKDFQQFTIIQQMINDLKMEVDLVVCPIKREKDGLAMSSRNVRLTRANRKNAVLINKVLKKAKRNLNKKTAKQIVYESLESLSQYDFKPEYFKLIHGHNLKSIRNLKTAKYVVAVTAVWAGDVRLIDNMILLKTK